MHPPMTRPISVAIVEDDMEFLTALCATITAAPDLTLAGTACTRHDGLQLLGKAAADVLVVDLGLPDGSGIDVIRAASLRWPSCALMVSTNFGDESHVMRSIEAGAAGYLLKHARSDSLAEEIRSIHRGESPISPLIARQMLMRFRNMPTQRPAEAGADNPPVQQTPLSPREREVLQLITKGFTTEEIAALIEVSSHTVLTFIRRIYRKLNVNSRAEAIYEARAQRLFE